jgi:hypothetical protein
LRFRRGLCGSGACFHACEPASLPIFIVGWFLIVVDHALDPVFELEHVKIDQEADFDIQQSEVRQELRLVHGMECFFTLDFNDEVSVDYQIGTKAAFQFHRFVNQWDGLLPLHEKS